MGSVRPAVQDRDRGLEDVPLREETKWGYTRNVKKRPLLPP